MTRRTERRPRIAGHIAYLSALLVVAGTLVPATSAAATAPADGSVSPTELLIAATLVDAVESAGPEQQLGPSESGPLVTEPLIDGTVPVGPSLPPEPTILVETPALPDAPLPVDPLPPTDSVAPTEPTPPTQPAAPPPPKFGTYGDSHTTYSKASIEEGRKAKGSWTHFAQSAEVGYAGYWAKNGATTADALKQVSCHQHDILVLLLGTNDITKNVSRPQIRANLRAIVRKECADQVLLVALPPRSDMRYAATTVSFNTSLKTLAKAQGWTFLDPWTKHRAKNGAWLQRSYAPDGLHATRAVYAQAGYAIRAAMQSMVR